VDDDGLGAETRALLDSAAAGRARMAALHPDVRAAVAEMAQWCRQHSSDGNIAVMWHMGALRIVGEHLVGATEFRVWENWTAPSHIVTDRAREGGRPGR